ncbi:MAG: hypothetical protein ACHREM_16965, partial [Polyangiales bacterium]
MRLLRLVLAIWMALFISCHSSTPAPASTQLPTDPDQLAAPAQTQGFQFKTGDVVVPAGTEEQDCYFFRISDLATSGGLSPTDPVLLHHIQVVQRDGSHHMNIFRVRTIVGLDPANGAVQTGTNGQGQCFKSANWADWPLVANMQQEGALDWTFPDGVVNQFAPTEWLMLQTHYVNATSQQTPSGAGKVAVNFFVLPSSQVTAQMGTLFATDQSIRVCQHNPTPTYQQGCQFKGSTGPINIIGANGHFHSRGVEFDMYSWDGTSTTTPDPSARFYQSTAWNEPPMLHSPDLTVVVPPGNGVWYTCSYQWTPPDEAVNGCTGLDAFDQSKGTAAADLDCCY